MEWMTMPLRRYADFDGRSRRKEYWMFYLFNLLVVTALWVVIGIVMLILYAANASESAMMAAFLPLGAVYLFYSLAMLIPGLAVTIRRMHDLDKSGWVILFALIPLVGPILLLVWLCSRGTEGANRFGPDPVYDGANAFA